MAVPREAVLADVIRAIEQITGDWETDVEIREDSKLLREVGLESIDLVALGSELEETYGRSFPYARFIAELGEENVVDLSVRQLVDFVTLELGSGSSDR
jgi:acyl carrier protein